VIDRQAVLHSLLVGILLAAGSVHAETYSHGNSTTDIEQSGGDGPSRSRVERYPNGQKIITRDGKNTDITIQREGGGAYRQAPDREPSGMNQKFFQRRFSGANGNSRFNDRVNPIDRDAFRQRLHDRMRKDW